MMQNVSKKRFGRLSAVLVLALAALVPVTVVAREPGNTRCMVVIDDDEGRRTIPCEEAGFTPPPRASAKKTALPPPPPLKRAAPVLAGADVVSIHLVLSERTRGLLGARELNLLKPGALLVNTSRGPIVDEPALIEAPVGDMPFPWRFIELPRVRGRKG